MKQERFTHNSYFKHGRLSVCCSMRVDEEAVTR